MRFRLTRESYVPKHYTAKIVPKTCNAVVYLVDNGFKPVAMGFAGKADKPTFHLSFRTPERRAEYITQWFSGLEAQDKARADRKAQRKAFKHGLTVGALLSTSWGYDQTNVEFFQVTALIGSSMVEIREIAQESEDTGYMSGKCVPVRGKFIGKPRRKRVLGGNTLDIHGGFGYASMCETEILPGVKVARAQYWSSYA